MKLRNRLRAFVKIYNKQSMDDKKQKLKNILDALSPLKNNVEGTFESFNKDVADSASSLMENITSHTLDRIGTEIGKLRGSIKPLGQAFTELTNLVNESGDELSSKFEKDMTESKNSVDQQGRITDVLSGKLNQLENNLGSSNQEISSAKQAISNLNKTIQGVQSSLSENLTTSAEGIKKELNYTQGNLRGAIDSVIGEVKTIKGDLKSTKENLAKKIDSVGSEYTRLRSDLMSRVSQGTGGGSMNRKIVVDGVDVLTRYTDINFISGDNLGITTTNNNTTKQLEMTFTATGGGGGATAFTGLTDTFPNYSGKASQILRVNAGETGVENSGLTIITSGNDHTLTNNLGNGVFNITTTTLSGNSQDLNLMTGNAVGGGGGGNINLTTGQNTDNGGTVGSINFLTGDSSNIGGGINFTTGTVNDGSTIGSHSITFTTGLSFGEPDDVIFNMGYGISGTHNYGRMVLKHTLNDTFGVFLDIENITADRTISFPDLSGTIMIGTGGGLIDLTTQVTGVLPVVNGGTGGGSFTANTLLIGNGSSALSSITLGSANKILSMNTGGTANEYRTVAFGTTAQSNDLGITYGSGTMTLQVPDASATIRGVITTGTQAFAGVKTFSNVLKYASDLSGSYDARTLPDKNYVDAIANTVNPALNRLPVRVASIINGTLASAFANGQTIDGIVLATGDRILIKAQTTAADNGIYTVNASGAPTRATDSDTAAEVAQGSNVYVINGTGIGLYVQINVITTLNTDPLSYALIGSPSAYIFGVSQTDDGTHDFSKTISGLNITYNLPTASASVRGALSSTDWSTFNSKAAGFSGSSTDKAIARYNGTAGALQDSLISISDLSINTIILSTIGPNTNAHNFEILGQPGSTAGGGIAILGGIGTGSGNGGPIQVNGGQGGASGGAGGGIAIHTGSAVSGNNSGGSLTIIAGDSSGNSTGGTIDLFAGTGGSNGYGGGITLTAGDGGGSSLPGGAVDIVAGYSANGNAPARITASPGGSVQGGGIGLNPGTGGVIALVNTPGVASANLIITSITTLDKNFTFPNISLTFAGIDVANSWFSGIKQTFAPSATTSGLNVGSVAGNPSGLANGDIWYNSTSNAINARINGVTVSLGPSGSGIPGGTSTQLQYNNAGAFGGIASAIFNGTFLDITDSVFRLQDNVDTTKKAQFELSGISTGITRTYTLPNATGTLPLLNVAQTWTTTQTFSIATPQTVIQLFGTGAVVVREYLIKAQVTTANATQATLFTGTLNGTTSLTGHLEVIVTGTSTASSKFASYVLNATIQGGATYAIVGSVQQTYVAETDATWDATIDVTGATYRVRVTGSAATNVQWTAHVRQFIYS